MVVALVNNNRNFSLNLYRYGDDLSHSQMFQHLFSFHGKCKQLRLYSFERVES